MNLMIINHYAGSDKYGMEFRPYYLGRELVKAGHDVTVIAADCSHLRKENPVIDKSFFEEYNDGVRYVFIKTHKYQKNDINRFLNMASFLNQLKKSSKMLFDRYHPEAIVASSTYPYDVKAACRIAEHGKGVKVCYEIHDIWPLSLIELYKLSVNNPYIRSLQKAEIFAYKNCDLVISILPHVDRHISELGLTVKGYVHIPNGVCFEEGISQPAPSEIALEIKRLKADGKFILMYLGGFSKANALDDFLAAADHMPDNIQLVLVGGGPLWQEIKEKAEGNGKGNISVFSAVAKPAVTSTLRLADALYIGAKRCHLYGYGVGMNKIFDYMLASRPIIYGIEASNDIVSDAGCGLTIKPEMPDEIAGAALTLSQMSEDEREALGENGYAYVTQNHNYKILAQQFVTAIAKCRGEKC